VIPNTINGKAAIIKTNATRFRMQSFLSAGRPHPACGV